MKSRKQSHNISIIIPTLNEEENIREVLDNLKRMGYNDVLIVDAQSTDDTINIAKNMGASILIQKGRGKGNALRQAFLNNFVKGDIIVFMDADGSMNPEEIPLFIKALDNGADVVKGSRFLDNAYSQDMNLMRRIGNLFLLFVVNFIHSTNYSDLCYGFGAFRKSAIEKIHPHLKSTNFEIEAEVFIKAKRMGLKVIEVPSIEYPRKNGNSNLNSFRDGFHILRTIIQESLF
jgi:glycosyltransferase involved in cell wall biosynthesis